MAIRRIRGVGGVAPWIAVRKFRDCSRQPPRSFAGLVIAVFSLTTRNRVDRIDIWATSASQTVRHRRAQVIVDGERGCGSTIGLPATSGYTPPNEVLSQPGSDGIFDGENIAEGLRAFVGTNGPSSFWPKATSVRLRSVDATLYEYISRLSDTLSTSAA